MLVKMPKRIVGLPNRPWRSAVVELEEFVVPVERHALREAPRELFDLPRGEALRETRVQAAPQAVDDARMHVGGARGDAAPHEEVREVDHGALVRGEPD